MQSISPSIEGSLPENTASWQARGTHPLIKTRWRSNATLRADRKPRLWFPDYAHPEDVQESYKYAATNPSQALHIILFLPCGEQKGESANGALADNR
jgi:hypothetical protein